MAHQQDGEVRVVAERELGRHRTMSPGVLKTWSLSANEPVGLLK